MRKAIILKLSDNAEITTIGIHNLQYFEITENFN